MAVFVGRPVAGRGIHRVAYGRRVVCALLGEGT